MSDGDSAAGAGAARYAPHAAWFVTDTRDGVICTRAWAPAERVVDVLHALSAHLESPVDVQLRDLRTGRAWTGALLTLAEVREVIGRMRLPLAACGGVEITVFTAEDQLTLTPELLLVVYARTGRWSYLLDEQGLEERPDMPPAVWRMPLGTLASAPALQAALEAGAARLALSEVVT